jgi:hypothetical protein
MITRDEVAALRLLETHAEHAPWIVETDKRKLGNNWLIASLGNDSDTGIDVQLTTDGLHASECRGYGAKADGDFIAAARNACADGLLDAAEWALNNGYGEQVMLPKVSMHTEEQRSCPTCGVTTPDFMNYSTVHAGDCPAVEGEDTREAQLDERPTNV